MLGRLLAFVASRENNRIRRGNLTLSAPVPAHVDEVGRAKYLLSERVPIISKPDKMYHSANLHFVVNLTHFTAIVNP